MGAESNDFHRLLVAPAAQRLLNIQPGEAVLDIACGNGNFSRRLAQLGAQVVATDVSSTMIARAQARTTEHADLIAYQVVDATDKMQLLELGESRFDAAVANMALMDIPTLEPLLEALTHMLKPSGRFVFAVGHPCFQAPNTARMVEEIDREGEIFTRYAVKVSQYITPAAHKGLAIIGQPEPQYYFHRPLSLLFRSCFRFGFVLDGLEEPAFDLNVDGQRPFSWTTFKEIPPVLVARMRLLSK
jgi:SAM-dependent methyltransferase